MPQCYVELNLERESEPEPKLQQLECQGWECPADQVSSDPRHVVIKKQIDPPKDLEELRLLLDDGQMVNYLLTSGEAASEAGSLTTPFLPEPLGAWPSRTPDQSPVRPERVPADSGSVPTSPYPLSPGEIDLHLLDRVPTNRGSELAIEILKSRVRVFELPLEHSRKRIEWEDELQHKQVELLGQRVKVVQHLDAQLSRWTSLAETGKWMLIFTVAFTAAAVGFVLFLLFDKRIDAWVAPTLIFVLALFAASPAVLLLLERPLKGIDEWAPAPLGEIRTRSSGRGDGQDTIERRDNVSV